MKVVDSHGDIKTWFISLVYIDMFAGVGFLVVPSLCFIGLVFTLTLIPLALVMCKEVNKFEKRKACIRNIRRLEEELGYEPS